MTRYQCLVLDHDDTVVQSEQTTGYPCLLMTLERFRPGATITLAEYARDCHELGFAEMCRRRWQFTQQELEEEFREWMDYVKTRIPPVFPGIPELIRRQRQEGGLVCVVSHSSVVNITRDYDIHIGLRPNAVYGWDYPEELRKPNPFPLLDIMEKYHLSPEELLVVDDMKLGCAMAAPLGIKIAFAAWGRKDFPDLSREMRSLCDYTFDTPEELGAFLFPDAPPAEL